MLTVQEFVIQTSKAWMVLGIPDGWKPLEPRHSKTLGEIILPAIVETEAPVEREIVRLVAAGEDLDLACEGVDSAPLGYVGAVPGYLNGVYLFLDLPSEEPEHMVSHPALLAQRARERQEDQESLQRELDSPDREV